jgi:hypothetical protein
MVLPPPSTPPPSWWAVVAVVVVVAGRVLVEVVIAVVGNGRGKTRGEGAARTKPFRCCCVGDFEALWMDGVLVDGFL